MWLQASPSVPQATDEGRRRRHVCQWADHGGQLPGVAVDVPRKGGAAGVSPVTAAEAPACEWAAAVATGGATRPVQPVVLGLDGATLEAKDRVALTGSRRQPGSQYPLVYSGV